MAISRKLKFGVLAVAAVVIPVVTNGCSAVQNAQNSLCCPEFQPGGDMTAVAAKADVSVRGNVYAIAQASGDLIALANQAAADVTTACRNIAVDLGTDPLSYTQDPNSTTPASDALTYWCGAAQTDLGTALKGVTLTATFDPPQCTASIQAQADCQARCDVSGKCDIKANPPTCTGGTLEVECKGDCDVTAKAPTIDCEGSCTGMCSGTCQAQGSTAVECDGTCDGTCAAGKQGSGIQADGSCKGTCSGTCHLRSTAKVSCQGSCSGTCDAKCTTTPGQVSCKCSGSCSADYQPLECKGGKLEGGCQVDAQCQANCNASVQARAECTPPKVSVSLTGGTDLTAVERTLEQNLPIIITIVKARGQQAADLIQTILQSAGSIQGTVNADTVGCFTAMIAQLQTAQVNFKATLNGSTGILTATNVK